MPTSGSPWESNIKKVVIENGVRNIGESAFYGCENLTDITIPDSVRSICQYAFLDCTNLTDITTSDSVTRIDDGAFSKELTDKDKLTAGKTYTAKFTLIPLESHMFTADTKVTVNGVEAKATSDDFCREVEYTVNFKTKEPASSADSKSSSKSETSSAPKKDSSSKSESKADNSSKKSDDTSKPDGKKIIKGDADLDCSINVTDIAMIASHIKGIKALEGDGLANADVNDDEKVNVTDIAMIAAHIKGIKPLV